MCRLCMQQDYGAYGELKERPIKKAQPSRKRQKEATYQNSVLCFAIFGVKFDATNKLYG